MQHPRSSVFLTEHRVPNASPLPPSLVASLLAADTTGVVGFVGLG